MKKMNYVLFTDTDTDATPEFAEEYGYKLISMPYTIGEKEVYPYQDFDKFEGHKFYDMLRNGEMPKTSGLSPITYENYFEPYLKKGKDILYVHFSAAMSGTFSAMNLALESLKEKYPNNNVYTIDTKGITILSYNIVKQVGKLYKQGKTIEEILSWAETEVDKFAIYFFANDLKFFKRSGRVKAFPAFMGNLLGIRPIMNMGVDGMMKALEKTRGLKPTMDRIVNYVVTTQDDIFNYEVVIGHTDCFDTAKILAEKLQEKFDNKLNIEFVMVNPTAGSHCGPDGIGVCFHAKGR